MDTAFPGTRQYLRTHLANAMLDDASFERPVARCDLAICAGTCCAHGASLNAEEALVIRQLTRRHDDLLRAWAPDLPAEPVVTEDGVSRTAVKPRDMHRRAVDYPAHFPDTACAYLADDARCALQRLAESQGHHPWAFKPLACWLHPIAISAECVTLPDATTDPYPGGFASVTHCGRTVLGGRRAMEALGPELAHLDRLTDAR